MIVNKSLSGSIFPTLAREKSVSHSTCVIGADRISFGLTVV